MQRDVCRAVRQRIHRRSCATKRINLAIDSLNSLFHGGGKCFNPWVVSDFDSLPLNRRDAIKSIVPKINVFGARPPGASRSEALRALRATSEGYVCPDAGVGSVCDMVLQQLNLPSSSVAGVDLAAVLEEPLRSIVRG